MTDQDAAAQLAAIIDAIAKEHGSTIDELSRDADLRRFFARQLALRGATTTAQLQAAAAAAADTPPAPARVQFLSIASLVWGFDEELLFATDAEGRLWCGKLRGNGPTALRGPAHPVVGWTELPTPEAPCP